MLPLIELSREVCLSYSPIDTLTQTNLVDPHWVFLVTFPSIVQFISYYCFQCITIHFLTNSRACVNSQTSLRGNL